MNHKYWMATAATLVLSGSLVAGCGSNGSSNNTSNSSGNQASAGLDPNQKVTISFYEAMPGKLGDTLKSLTQDFESQHPNVTVNLVFNGSYTTEKQKLTAAIAAQKPPTIAQVQETWETDYYNNGLLQPLQDLLDPSTVNDLMPIWKADSSYDGKLVSAPFNKSAYVMYYNTDDFAKAGISAPPKTWDELEQDAVKLTKATGIPGMGMQANWYTFEMFLYQAGGQDLSADEKQAAFNSDAGKSALSFMGKLANEKAATVIGQNAYLSDGFNTHQYSMDLDTVAAMSFITNKDTHWKVAPLPTGVKAAVPTAGTNIVLFKKASSDEQKAAAEYINFLISKDNTIKWAEATGYLPVLQSALSDSEWQNFTSKNPNKGVAPADMGNAYFSPRVATLFSGENSATTEIGNYISSKGTVEDTLSKMEKDINNALAGQ